MSPIGNEWGASVFHIIYGDSVNVPLPYLYITGKEMLKEADPFYVSLSMVLNHSVNLILFTLHILRALPYIV